MAIVKRKILNVLTLSTWETFLNELNCPILSVNTTDTLLTCRLDSTNYGFTIDSSSNSYLNFSYMEAGSISASKYAQMYVPIEITVGYSGRLFYMQVQSYDTGSSGESRHRFIFIYENIDSVKLCGSSGTGSSTSLVAFYDITSVNMYNLSDGNIYNYGNRIPYRVNPDSIDYTSSTPLVVSGAEALSTTSFINCTIVNPDSVLTFNRQNYYSVGNNILLPMER